MILAGKNHMSGGERKPRASGDDPESNGLGIEGCVVNPARAGMIPSAIVDYDRMNRKPRASGDDPIC